MRRGGTTEGTWERGPSPGSVRALTFAIALAVGAGSGVFLVARSGGPGVGAIGARPTPLPVAEPAAASDDAGGTAREGTAPHLPVVGDPRAVVVYPTGGDTTVIAVVHRDGWVAPCASGHGALSLGDFADGQILYVDQGNLFALDARCDRMPRRLVDRRDFGTEQPSFWRQAISCPHFAPDGDRFAFSIERQGPGPRLFLGSLSGREPVPIADIPGCGWLDEDHVLAAGRDIVDAYAIPVDGSQPALLRTPWFWHGAVTPDGRTSIYRRGGRAFLKTFGLPKRVLRVPTRSLQCVEGATRAFGVLDGVLQSEGTHRSSIWDARGERALVGGRGSDLYVVRADGGRTRTIPMPFCEQVGWWGLDHVLLMEDRHGSRSLRILPLWGGPDVEIPLPGAYGWWNPDGASFLTERSLWLPVGSEPLEPVDLQPAEDRRMGIALAKPRSWTFERCRECDARAGRPRPLALASWRPHYRPSSQAAMTLSREPERPDAVRERLFEEWDVGVQCIEKLCGEVMVEDALEIDGRRFEIFELKLYEGSVSILIGPHRTGSLLISMPAPLYRTDLTVMRALESLRSL